MRNNHPEQKCALNMVEKGLIEQVHRERWNFTSRDTGHKTFLETYKKLLRKKIKEQSCDVSIKRESSEKNLKAQSRIC